MPKPQKTQKAQNLSKVVSTIILSPNLFKKDLFKFLNDNHDSSDSSHKKTILVLN